MEITDDPGQCQRHISSGCRGRTSIKKDMNTLGKTRAAGFSLVLGTFGRTDELAGYLASLDAQTYRNFELLIVDQNPDERLTPILAPYEGRFELLHLRSEKGLSRANNLGLERASRKIVGFPDDDCRYPPNLLERVAEFFATHQQEADGLCGRSVDENGRGSNGHYDPEPGPISKFNVWRRSVQYSVFMYAESARSIRFDEDLGPGSGTPCWAADETDYLLQLLGRGAALYYDPTLAVVHPNPVPRYDERAMRRAYHYGYSMGHVLRKHRYPAFFVARMLLYHPLRRAALALLRGRSAEARFLWNALRGRLKGWLGQGPCF